jgi:hypothetical protein
MTVTSDLAHDARAVGEVASESMSAASANALPASAERRSSNGNAFKSRVTPATAVVLAATTYHALDGGVIVRRLPRPAVALLQRRCSGALGNERSRSSCPRSHGAPGAMSRRHRLH